MTTTAWSRFFWADWLSDANLRRCSPAARGVWMDMLCIAAQNAPVGYLSTGNKPLTSADIAKIIGGVSEEEAANWIAELESNSVFSRDRKGVIYSRRMVEDAHRRQIAAKNGAKGGNPSLSKQRTIPPPDKGEVKAGVKLLSQKPEARTAASTSDVGSASAPAGSDRFEAARAMLQRAATAMGVSVDALRKLPSWMLLGDVVAGLVDLGCDAERDIWPTIERVSRRGRITPQTPHYFRKAILEARDLRLAALSAHANAGAVEHADRLAAFKAYGAWSSQWGPKPSGD